jgi:hypothetical protein
METKETASNQKSVDEKSVATPSRFQASYDRYEQRLAHSLVQEKEIEWQTKMQQHMGSIRTMRP